MLLYQFLLVVPGQLSKMLLRYQRDGIHYDVSTTSGEDLGLQFPRQVRPFDTLYHVVEFAFRSVLLPNSRNEIAHLASRKCIFRCPCSESYVNMRMPVA